MTSSRARLLTSSHLQSFYIMGGCHRFDSILSFIMLSSMPSSFTGLASGVMKFLVHFLTQ